MKEQAWKEAFEEGRKQGEQEAARLLEEAREVLENAWKERQEILAGAEAGDNTNCCKYRQRLTTRWKRFQLHTGAYGQGFECSPHRKKCILKVNPMDEKICRENFHLLQEQLKQEIVLELQGDQGIPVGSCEVESEEVEVEILYRRNSTSWEQVVGDSDRFGRRHTRRVKNNGRCWNWDQGH